MSRVTAVLAIRRYITGSSPADGRVDDARMLASHGMADDTRTRIHLAFPDSGLPRGIYTKTRIGSGTGAPCTGCEDPILTKQAEYAFDHPTRMVTYRFHARCYVLWLRLYGVRSDGRSRREAA